MAVWQLHESRGLGKENKVWQLEREGLAVGRSSECDIQILVCYSALIRMPVPLMAVAFLRAVAVCGKQTLPI